MSLIVKRGTEQEKTSSIPPCPEGIFNAVCIGVFDLGTHLDTRFDKKNKRIGFTFELEPTIETEGQFKGKRYVLSTWDMTLYTKSLPEKATLTTFLTAWLGAKALTDGVDVFGLVGTGAMITVVHNTGAKGGTFANISAIAKLGKSPLLKIENVGYKPHEKSKFGRLIASQLPETAKITVS